MKEIATIIQVFHEHLSRMDSPKFVHFQSDPSHVHYLENEYAYYVKIVIFFSFLKGHVRGQAGYQGYFLAGQYPENPELSTGKFPGKHHLPGGMQTNMTPHIRRDCMKHGSFAKSVHDGFATGHGYEISVKGVPGNEQVPGLIELSLSG
ncbi:MAG: hypothetical protein STSR0009_24900 [Methanoregula sp.]